MDHAYLHLYAFGIAGRRHGDALTRFLNGGPLYDAFATCSQAMSPMPGRITRFLEADSKNCQLANAFHFYDNREAVPLVDLDRR